MADERSPGEPDPATTPTRIGLRRLPARRRRQGSGRQAPAGRARLASAPAVPASGGQPGNPFEAFMNQFGGGDMNQLMSSSRRLRHAGRRRLAVRSAHHLRRLRRELGGDQGHRPQDRRVPRRRSQPRLRAAARDHRGGLHRRGLAGCGDRLPPGQHRRVAPGAGRSGSRTPCRSGSGWSSRSPPTSPTPWRAR